MPENSNSLIMLRFLWAKLVIKESIACTPSAALALLQYTVLHQSLNIAQGRIR